MYITHIAHELDPSLCVFNQGQMRKHLIQCFEKEELQPFPILKERRSSGVTKVTNCKVYCYCRCPYNGEKMVKCNGECGEWYHVKCVHTTIKPRQKWYCNIPT